MTCSEFHFMGMPILESTDMVNWRIIGRVYDRIDLPGYPDMSKYAGRHLRLRRCAITTESSIFCLHSLRGPFHDHRHCPPARGTLHLVKGIEVEDPCPFWDDNGEAYLVQPSSRGPIIIHRIVLTAAARLMKALRSTKVRWPKVRRCSKKDGYYYISIPEGGVSTDGTHSSLKGCLWPI